MPSPQRMPAKEKKISEISVEDTRVNVIGTVVDSKENILAIDDGTGKIDVSFEEKPDIETGKMVRVIGRVISMEGGMELQGEISQDFSGVDLDLWKNASSLWEDSLKQL